ncbi:MAG: hypothetical protein EAZ57_01755 [Cytophagales bacterium]|nr:MAG: hypothetical protein EAZ67_02835 [Cytophagales bacterium]TAF61849.1 MAG: hypothetical protein EAZ57_01755 [Cytophagales bacterium]
MRFRILNTWLLVTAVIASLSLVSCTKDCGETQKSAPNAFTKLGPKRKFYFYLVEKGTGKPYLTHTGSDLLFKSVKDDNHVVIFTHEGSWGTNNSPYELGRSWDYSVTPHKNYGVVFGPVVWEQSGWELNGHAGFLIRLKEITAQTAYGPIFGRLDSTAIYLYPKAEIIDECNSLVWIEYYMRRPYPTGGGEIIRPYFYKGNSVTDTLRIEL